jgi:hypothetical protein
VRGCEPTLTSTSYCARRSVSPRYDAVHVRRSQKRLNGRRQPEAVRGAFWVGAPKTAADVRCQLRREAAAT